MHTWHWRTWSGLPYLTCSILDPWFHGFFTRQFSPRLPEELTQVLQSAASVYRLKQVHGNLVLSPTEVVRAGFTELSMGQSKLSTNPPLQETGGQGDNSEFRISNFEFPQADGLITEQAEQAVWVASADCTPVLLADSKTGQVAAVHAGWRGTALKIVPQAIARLLAQSSQIQDLRIALGPAIAGEVYQVSTTVASQVGASILPDREAQSLLDALQQLPDSPVLPDPHPERVRLDIRRVIALQLEQLGVSSEQVAIAPYCTYQEPDYFFSYRRNKLKKVQWSGIVSTDPS